MTTYAYGDTELDELEVNLTGDDRFDERDRCRNTLVDWVQWENSEPNRLSVYRVTRCGESYGGQMELCDPCMADAQEFYPQGWRYYPGDVCKHGRYVGGIGADYMCGACELGE